MANAVVAPAGIASAERFGAAKLHYTPSGRVRTIPAQPRTVVVPPRDRVVTAAGPAIA
jgi:hypothetical protein